MTATLLFLAIVIPAIGIPFVAILGWAHRLSRSQIAAAADLAKEGEFRKARHLVLTATRFNTSLLRNPDVRALYDVILSEPKIDDPVAIERAKAASLSWPATRAEAIATSGWFKIVILMLLLICISSRLSSLR